MKRSDALTLTYTTLCGSKSIETFTAFKDYIKYQYEHLDLK